MRRDYRRIARAAFAPRSIIFGLATFMFGWALVYYVRSPMPPYYDGESADLFVASTLLAASAALSTRRARGNILAAILSSPLPLIHVIIFLESAHRAEAILFSASHLETWLRQLSSMPTFVLLAGALSFAVLLPAAASALRRPAAFTSDPRARAQAQAVR